MYLPEQLGRLLAKLAISRRLRRRGVPLTESAFPYRPRPQKNFVPTHSPATWQSDVESVRTAGNGAQILGATLNVTAGGNLQVSAERISEQLNSNGDPEDEKGKETLEDIQQIPSKRQSSTEIFLTSPDLECFSLDLGDTSTEDMTRSWWSRRFPPILRARQRTDPCKSTNVSRGAENSICPCNGCSSPSNFLEFTETMLFSKPTKHGEISRFRGKLRAIDFTSWFRQHQRSWSEPSESLPLTAERLSQLRVRDVNLEIERTQIVNELAMTQDFLRYIFDAISRLQPHNQVRVNMIREYKRLKDQETSLVDHLQDIEHEMDHINELENPRNCEFADFSHESILPIEPSPIQLDPRQGAPWKKSRERCGVMTLPKVKHVTNANLQLQLQLYNEKWTVAQKSMNSPASSLSIPWPTNSHNLPSQPQDSIRPLVDQSDAEQAWKLAAYEFFCSPFGLVPLIYEKADSGKTLDFVIPAEDSRERAMVRLRELKGQLKMEKTRWHEDKLRGLFGDAVAMDDRAKAIWSAVMELNVKVDGLLEDFNK